MLTSDPGFVPPHCPNADCRHHRQAEGWAYVRKGFYQRQIPPRRIARFRCRSCGRYFSTQTFDVTYWLHAPQHQRPVFHGLVSCAASRQMARALEVSHSTVGRHAARLGRHCLLYQFLHGPHQPPPEPLVLDGLLSFERGQYWPFEINVLVGSVTHHVYGFSGAELRRSGRMTKPQKRRRAVLEARHGKADPRATRRSVEELLQRVVPPSCHLTLLSDEHQAYPRALRCLPTSTTVTHHAVSSRRNRRRGNLLYNVDLWDLLLRHVSADHKRETIAFCKRRACALLRVCVRQLWRNFIKRTSENRSDSLTPAQLLGLRKTGLKLDELLERRLFPTRADLPPALEQVYSCQAVTRALQTNLVHALKYAA